MATVVLPPSAEEARRGADWFLFAGAGWDLYERLDAWAGERAGVRLVYIDGDVVVMGKSRRHDWIGLRVHDLVWALADAAGVACEDAGETTFRERAREAGAQADQSYFFGENAAKMSGPKNVEPGVDPVPDLTIEVEVGHPVDHALRAWARLGVPEVWHLDATGDGLRLRVLRLAPEGAPYTPVNRSEFLPVSDAEILALLRPCFTEGSQTWRARLAGQVAQVLGRRGV